MKKGRTDGRKGQLHDAGTKDAPKRQQGVQESVPTGEKMSADGTTKGRWTEGGPEPPTKSSIASRRRAKFQVVQKGVDASIV